ncbi:hypothetical protein EDC01DRAFT_370458 [Geopyxis carbonaria]|nr:hypothetical protein EDC01DRAFT_370458 [Geopyxis carbonaria]
MHASPVLVCVPALRNRGSAGWLGSWLFLEWNCDDTEADKATGFGEVSDFLLLILYCRDVGDSESFSVGLLLLSVNNVGCVVEMSECQMVIDPRSAMAPGRSDILEITIETRICPISSDFRRIDPEFMGALSACTVVLMVGSMLVTGRRRETSVISIRSAKGLDRINTDI